MCSINKKFAHYTCLDDADVCRKDAGHTAGDICYDTFLLQRICLFPVFYRCTWK
jgi:hypothetical protein